MARVKRTKIMCVLMDSKKSTRCRLHIFQVNILPFKVEFYRLFVTLDSAIKIFHTIGLKDSKQKV